MKLSNEHRSTISVKSPTDLSELADFASRFIFEIKQIAPDQLLRVTFEPERAIAEFRGSACPADYKRLNVHFGDVQYKSQRTFGFGELNWVLTPNASRSRALKKKIDENRAFSKKRNKVARKA